MQIIELSDFGVRAAVYRVRRRFSPLQFDLYPMLHVGRPEYYDEVKRRLREADVIIAEGVHCEPGCSWTSATSPFWRPSTS